MTTSVRGFDLLFMVPVSPVELAHLLETIWTTFKIARRNRKPEDEAKITEERPRLVPCYRYYLGPMGICAHSWPLPSEQMIPQALQLAMEEDVEYRKSLPRGYLNYMGVANADVVSDAREAFLGKVRHLVEKLVNYCPVDAAVDQCGKAHLHEALPPLLSQGEHPIPAAASCTARSLKLLFNNLDTTDGHRNMVT
ncbi:bifunctional lysine-specific demethylase and histidyl-hydroxylase NO66-like [Dermacentor variabilis]|uniref:bifunctional lysine-specific demethylase and histidyl-hydroxylase NO66-like n=1 Tax=Dermacentor variabilis TaxID=34621 RepID=UPI003F5C5675